MNLRKRITAAATLLLILNGLVAAEESKLPAGVLSLVADGRSDYRIVLPQSASPQEQRAAEELRDFIKQIAGVTLPIAADDQPPADKEIVLGRSSRLGAIDAKLELDKLGDEGFAIRSVGPRLVIAGGSGRGTLYGVYAFLEEHLGCRWYTPKVSFVPTQRDITLGSIDQTQTPAMTYREVYYAECRDPVFCVRQKLNAGFAASQPSEIVQQAVSGNGWAHTLFNFLPPDKYFAAHPEYFALRDGQRKPTQPCLTNPEVLRIVTEELRKVVQANPQPRYWSVSQMDNDEFCTCDKCKAIDDREGSPAGSVVEFVNKVAEQFPDKFISTLGYWYTMRPPKTVKPAKNVHIMFCIDTNHTPPYHDYLDGWSKIAPRMYVWYYVIPCHNFIAPWPNLRRMAPQIKDYVAHGASGMFNEGGYNAGSEFAELRGYLLAKIMWNPDADVNALIDDFLRGYYGQAAAGLHKYIDALHGALKKDEPLDTHDWSVHHANDFLAPAVLAQYGAAFDEAEKAVAGDAELLLRVRHARMPLMHAELQLHYGDVDRRIANVKQLGELAAATGVDFFSDFNVRPREQYLAGILDALQKEKAAKP